MSSNYVEAFAGSAAMLLGAPDGKRELHRSRFRDARRFDLGEGFGGMRPATRRLLNSRLVRFGKRLSKFGFRELFPMLGSKRLSKPCGSHLFLGLFRVLSSSSGGRDFGPGLIRMFRPHQRGSNFFPCFLRYNPSGQRFASPRHRFCGALSPSEGVGNFFDVIRGKILSSFCGSHFFFRLSAKNQPSYAFSAIRQIHQINPASSVKSNPLLFSESPIPGSSLYNIHERCQADGGKLVDPIRLVRVFRFCTLNVLRKPSLLNEAPANIADHVTPWVGKGVNGPGFFYFWHAYILQHIAIYIVNCIGWHTRSWKARKGYAMTDEATENSASETLWCSPHCVPVEPVVDLFSSLQNTATI